GDVKTIDPRALSALESYRWPGNVRELRNVIERAVVLAEGATLTIADLTERVRGGSRATAESDPDLGRRSEEPDDRPDGEALEPGDYREHVRRYETELILRALHKHHGNQTEAARSLNLPLRTLVHKIQSYGIKKKFDR